MRLSLCLGLLALSTSACAQRIHSDSGTIASHDFGGSAGGSALLVDLDADWVHIKCEGLPEPIVISPARGRVTLKNVAPGWCVARVPNDCTCSWEVGEAEVHLGSDRFSHHVGRPFDFRGRGWWDPDRHLGLGCRFRAGEPERVVDTPGSLAVVSSGEGVVIHEPNLLFWRVELLDREYRLDRLPR